MNFFKNVAKFIFVLLALLFLFFIVCAINPDISKKIGNLFPKSVSANSSFVSENGINTVVNISSGDPSETVWTPETQPSDFVIPDTGSGYQDPEQDTNINSDTDADHLDFDSTGIAVNTASGYVPPNRESIVIPEAVSGRNGYASIQEENEQVSREEADQIRTRLGAGYTGDGLYFDPYWYPYYSMLDDRGQHIYRQIYANANELNAAFEPVEAVTAGQFRNALLAVFCDHPEMFWLELAYYCKCDPNGQCVEVQLRFNRTAQDLSYSQAAFHEAAGKILEQAYSLPNDYEKEVYVHDTLIRQVSYNLNAELNQNAYSALVNGQTVCAGYARAFQYLMQELNVPCYFCAGYAGEKHAWNIIMLSNEFYNVDATWDDVDGGNYDYFNKTDSDYAKDHLRQELSVYLPPCDGQMYRDLENDSELTDQTNLSQNLRTLTDVGLTEDRVFQAMDKYYQDCYNQIRSKGRGNYTFYNVIEGRQLMLDWRQAMEDEGYKSGYMDNVMRDIGATSCEIRMQIEELQGDRFLIVHRVSIY